MSGGGTCPVCREPMPAPKRTGRPAVFCSVVCRKRADRRRSQAAVLYEYADRVEAGIGRPGMGSEDGLRARATGLRAQATALLAGGIGPGAAC
jgi:hypothetical protein